MQQAFFRALGQMADPVFIRVFLVSLVATGALMAALVISGTLGLLFALPAGPDWLAWLLAAGWVMVGLFGAWWLFSAVMIAVTGLFLDDIIDAVERRFYPGARSARLGMAAGLRAAAGFALLVLLVNTLLLPVYALMIFFPPAAALIFFAVNAWLFGREYFNAVALRHMPAAAAADLRRRNGKTLFIGGAIVTLAFITPPLLLAAPIFAAAFFTHLFHGMQAQPVVIEGSIL